MDDQLRICRVCREGEGDGELVPVYEKNNKIAIGIYVLSGVKVLCIYLKHARVIKHPFGFLDIFI